MRSFHRANSPNSEQEGKPGEPAMRVIRKYLGLQALKPFFVMTDTSNQAGRT